MDVVKSDLLCDRCWLYDLFAKKLVLKQKTLVRKAIKFWQVSEYHLS